MPYYNKYTYTTTLSTFRNLTLVNSNNKNIKAEKSLVPTVTSYIHTKPNKVVRTDLLLPSPPDLIEQPKLVRTRPNTLSRVEMAFGKAASAGGDGGSAVGTATAQSAQHHQHNKFEQNGRCKEGTKCAYKHDEAKIPVCKDWLKGSTCSRGSDCYFQHSASPYVVPHCKHFKRGPCYKEGCRYTHVHVARNASLCRNFIENGYCEKGNTCKEKHEWLSKEELEDELKKGNKRSLEEDSEESAQSAKSRKVDDDNSGPEDIWGREFISLKDI
ncbi:11473_t:CDS:2 [Ambispora leptoticha]|uniref:11473_t:CDS:1 n=1 Tax=Ambispora leptoticha TaxID=144679 RepID=A0A9N8VN08_9GLOM|nr:11473_t:CDS:2 [Ambispora leptoticha]